MRPFFAHHYMALVLAILVGAVCAAPQVYFALHSPQYAGITLTGQDGEEHTLARMQEMYDGHLALGNVFLPEKTTPYFAPGGGELVATALGVPFFLSAAEAEIAGKFVFPFLIVLSIYTLSYAITRSRIASLAAAAAVAFGDTLISGKAAWIDLLHGTSSSISFLALARPVNPEVSGLLLWLGLLLIYRIFFARTARAWESALFAVLLAGGLYISIYIYSFLGMTLLLTAGWLVWRREWPLVLRALCIGAAGLLGALPYAINYHALTQAAGYADSALRQGVVLSHEPVIGLWVPIILLGTLFAWPGRFAAARPFFFLSALALLLLSNQQILTGHELQVNHYHWYITRPLVFVVIAIYGAHLLDRFVPQRTLRHMLWIAAIAVVCANALLIQINSYRAHAPKALERQAYAPILKLLNGLPEGAVWANRDLSLIIPIYTRYDAPNNDYMMYYLVPQPVIEKRLLLEYKLRGITPAHALSTMQAERIDIAKRLFGVYWRDQAGSYAAIPDSLLQQYAAAYKAVYAAPLAETFKSLGIGMAIKDTQSDAWMLEGQGVALSTTTGRFELYTIK